MKSEPVSLGDVQLHRPGTLIGKALEPLEKGFGRDCGTAEFAIARNLRSIIIQSVV